MKVSCNRHKVGIFKCGCPDCDIRIEKTKHKDSLLNLELKALSDKGFSEDYIGSMKDKNSVIYRIATRIYRG